MGTIQNSFNQLLGMTAGAVGIGKHLSEQAYANKVSALNMAEDYESKAGAAQKEADALAASQKELNKDYEKNKNAREHLVTGNTLTEDERNYKIGLIKSLQSLENRQEALTEQQKSFDERLNILRERKKLTEEKLGKGKLKDVKVSQVPKLEKSAFQNKLDKDPILKLGGKK